MSGKVLTLVTGHCSHELERAVEALLDDIRRQRTIGLAWVAMHKTYDYSVHIAGETRRCPTLTRGMLHLLDDELSLIIRR